MNLEFLDHLPISLFELNLDKRITYINKTGQDLLSYIPNLYKIKFDKLFSKECREEFRTLYKDVLELNKKISKELQINTKDTIGLPVLLVLSPIIRDEVLIGLTGAIIDISQQKKTEKELIEARINAEIASMTKSKFLANMSHEIRTPMNAILGFTDILAKNIQDKKSIEFLEAIKSSSEALRRLITDILDLSKIESGKIEIQTEAVNMHRLLDEIRYIFQKKIEDKNLDFSINIDKNIPYELELDKIRLQQILINIITNAERFTHIGFVKVTVNAEINESEDNVQLSISIEDSGIGIEHSQIDKIFEPFAQHSNQDLSEYGGTGLGLAITKKLVDAMNGTISVNSAPGRGSKFTILLPGVRIVNMINQVAKEEPQGEIIGGDALAKLVKEKVNLNPPDKKDLLNLMIKNKKISDDMGIFDKISDKIININNNREKSVKLLKIIEQKLYPEWQNAKRHFIMNEIEKFTGKVYELAKEYQSKELLLWAKELLAQVNSFDMESLPVTLEKFPQLIENIVVELENEISER